MTKNGDVCGGNREWNFRQRRIKRFNVNDSVFLVVQAQSAQETGNFEISIRWPNTDVITVLVADTGTLSLKFDMDTVSAPGVLEQLPRYRNRCGEGILGIVNTLGLGEGAGRVFTFGG